jgi:hypothetical protein
MPSKKPFVVGWLLERGATSQQLGSFATIPLIFTSLMPKMFHHAGKSQIKALPLVFGG